MAHIQRREKVGRASSSAMKRLPVWGKNLTVDQEIQDMTKMASCILLLP
jgi:hypothetical protein